jgi:hypothetical protein
MALSYLLDENLPGRFVRAVERHNARGIDPINAVRVGEPDDVPLGADDPTILAWSEREGRILVSEDKNTMPRHLSDHLAKGNHSPGVFLVRPRASVPEVLEFLVLVAHVSEPAE